MLCVCSFICVNACQLALLCSVLVCTALVIALTDMSCLCVIIMALVGSKYFHRNFGGFQSLGFPPYVGHLICRIESYSKFP